MMVNRNPEYFLAVARERNISRAAEKLYISQSSLSQHIAKLEESLEVKLFDRSQTPIALTEAGALYRNYLESNIYLYKKFQSGLTDLNSDRSQTVNVGLGTWRGSILFPEILPDFLKEHPQARANLYEYPVSELNALVQDDKADFAVRNTEVTGLPNLVSENIAYERILLVMHRDDPVVQEFTRMQAARKKVDLHLLEQGRFISLDQTLPVGRHVSNFLEKNKLSFSNRLNTTNNSTALRLVSAGTGFCFLVETGLQNAAQYPNLVFFDLQSPDLSISLSMLYKSNSYLSPLACSLMNMIREYYQALIKNNSPLKLQ